MDILHQVKIGQHAASSSEVNATAKCAGIAPILPSLLPDNSFIHSWILDSDASEHMTFDKSILFDIIVLTQPLTVNLPNSYKIRVTHAGKVSLFPDMILDRVLYVPSFKFNLLSVHKFCYQFGCDLIFSAFLCSLQGLSLERPLDLGRLSNGLYLLRSKHYPSGQLVGGETFFISSTECTSNSSPIQSMSTTIYPCQNVWHIRLGHMPLSNMKNIAALPQFALNKAGVPCTIFP